MSKNLHADETQRLHRLARKDGVRLITAPHADEEMRKDGISKLDVRTMLKRGFVASVELVRRRWRWTVDGRDSDGRQITAVVEAEEEKLRLFIVTAWCRR